MCARYTRVIDSDGVDDVFDLADELDEAEESRASAALGPTWNAAPGTSQLIVAQARGRSPRRRSALWGVSAPWADRPLVNARSESVHSKPTFRRSFEQHRCIVPATGFYEWSSRTKAHTPSLFVVGDQVPFAMAGVWAPGDGGDPARFCILTTEPNETVAPVHDRMPVILDGHDVARWLDPSTDPQTLRGLFSPYGGRMRSWNVSKKVNGTRIDAPELVEPWSNPQLSLL